MKKTLCICFCLVSVLLQAGCGRAPVPEEPELPAFEKVGEAGPVSERSVETLPTPDAEGLRELLDRAAEGQPCTAGSSLRLSALAGELLYWLSENPGGTEAAREIALSWAARRTEAQGRRAAGTMSLLNEAAARMGEEELEGLLEDAGFPLPEPCPEKEAFLALTEELSRSLLPGIFKNPGEIMNISGGNHCGAEKSVL